MNFYCERCPKGSFFLRFFPTKIAISDIVGFLHRDESNNIIDENSNTVILKEKSGEIKESDEQSNPLDADKLNNDAIDSNGHTENTENSDQIELTNESKSNGNVTCVISTTVDETVNSIVANEHSDKNGVVDENSNEINNNTVEMEKTTPIIENSEEKITETENKTDSDIKSTNENDNEEQPDTTTNGQSIELVETIDESNSKTKNTENSGDSNVEIFVENGNDQGSNENIVEMETVSIDKDKAETTIADTTIVETTIAEPTKADEAPSSTTSAEKSSEASSDKNQSTKPGTEKKSKNKRSDNHQSKEPKDTGTPLANKSIVKNIYEPSQADADDASNKYGLFVSERQRKYYLKGQKDSVKMPADDCEVFCSNIPTNVLENDLIPLFERYGTIWHLRLLMKANNPKRNAGFSFIRFMDANAAREAAKNLNHYEIVPGKNLSVKQSKPNLSLFVGNIHRAKTKDQVHEKFSRITNGLVKTVVKSSFYEESKNCGFCFLQYDSHSSAYVAKRKLDSVQTKVWGRQLFVDWSDRRLEPDAEQLKNTKTLFVNNLPKTATSELVKEKFQTFGEVNQVTVIKDYAFVLFKNREDALNALQKFDVMDLNDKNIEISLAISKPVQITKYGYRENYHLRYGQKRYRNSRGGFGRQGRFNNRTPKPAKNRKQININNINVNNDEIN